MNIFEPELSGIGSIAQHYNQHVDSMVFGEICDPSQVISEVVKRAQHACQEAANNVINGQVGSF